MWQHTAQVIAWLEVARARSPSAVLGLLSAAEPRISERNSNSLIDNLT